MIPALLALLVAAVAAPAHAGPVSLQVEGLYVPLEGSRNLSEELADAGIGLHWAFAEHHGLRAHLIAPVQGYRSAGGEIGYVARFPARLDAMVSAGRVDLGADSETFYRVGLYFRAMDGEHAAFLFGAGVHVVDPSEGEAESDPWFSVGFRGR